MYAYAYLNFVCVYIYSRTYIYKPRAILLVGQKDICLVYGLS